MTKTKSDGRAVEYRVPRVDPHLWNLACDAEVSRVLAGQARPWRSIKEICATYAFLLEHQHIHEQQVLLRGIEAAMCGDT